MDPAVDLGFAFQPLHMAVVLMDIRAWHIRAYAATRKERDDEGTGIGWTASRQGFAEGG
jgi:hypothetical protein